VDVYALGLVMIECLTGRPAFEGTAAEITSARLVRDPDVPDVVPPRWRALLRAMTARDPDLRPRASRVAVELHAASTPPTRTLPVAVVPSSTDRTAAAARSGPRLRRNLVALVGLTIATFLGVAAVVEATGGPDHASTTTTTTSVVSTSTTVPPVTAAAPVVTTATTTATRAPRPHRGPAGETGGDHGHGHGRHGDG
jgi:serine/threonine protein kinase